MSRNLRLLLWAAILTLPLLFAAEAAVAQIGGPIALGDLPDGKKVRVHFDVTVDSPLGPLVMGVANQGVVASSTMAFGPVPTDDPADGTSEVDFTVTPLDGLTIGDRVWKDDDGDMMFGGIGGPGPDTALPLIKVNLYLDDGTTPGSLDAGDTFLLDVLTDPSGLYSFTGLQPGDYIVEVDECNFSGSTCPPLLAGLSTIVDPAPDPDGDVDDDDNGEDLLPLFGVAAKAVTLAFGAETLGDEDGDGDTDTNLTVDFGFTVVADLAIDKSDDGTDAKAGATYDYTIKVTNLGPGASSGSTVTDPLPTGWTYVSSTGTCLGDGGSPVETVTCTVGAISAAGMVSFDITAMVPASAAAGTVTNSASVVGNEGDLVPGNNSDPEMTTVVLETDLALDKSDDGTDAVAGSNYSYDLKVTNNGPSNSTGGSLSDTLPTGWAFVSATGGTCVATAAGFDCTVGALIPTGMQTFTVTVSVPSSASAGTVTNTASVTANETDSTAGNDSDSEMTTVVLETDLEMDKSDDGTDANAGGTYDYDLKVTNNGPSDSTGGTVTDTLPAGWTFVSATGGTCATAAGGFTCTVGALADGAMQTFVATVSVPAAAAAGTVTNSATVTANETDSTAGNDTGTEMTTVQPQVDLSIDKSDSGVDAVPGATYDYTLTVTNLGPGASTGSTVTDTLPSDWTFVSSTGACVGDGLTPVETVTCTVGAVAFPGMSSFDITVMVPPSAVPATVTNSASVAGVQVDPVAGNDSDSEMTTVGPAQADLSITKDDAFDPVQVMKDLTYIIVATNDGPSDTTNLEITDTLPPNTTFVAAAALDGGSCTTPAVGGTGTVTCTWTGTTEVAEDRALILAVKVENSAADGSTISNTATVSSDATDPGPSVNAATAVTTVINEADLSIVKDDGVATAVPGASTTYTITVTGSETPGLFSVSPEDSLLTTINPATGASLGTVAITLAGETVLGGNGLATHPGTGELWAILKLQGQTSRELVTIDSATGVATSVGDTGEKFAGLAFNADGSVLYGVTGDGATTAETLFTLSQVDATPTLAVALGNGDDGETIAFNPADGLIYHASGLGFPIFETIDPIGLGIVNVPLSGVGYSEATGLVYDSASGGFLLGDLSADFFNVTSAGVVSILGFTDHVAKGLAFAPDGTDVVGATVTDTFPPELACTWTCAAAGGASCTAGPVAGDINDTVDIPGGDSVTYTAVCAIDSAALAPLSNTATVAPPAGVTDPNALNDSSTDVDTLTPMADLVVTKTESADPVVAGVGLPGNLTYVVTVENNGPSDVTGVSVSEDLTLPAPDVTVDSVTPSAGAFTPTVAPDGTWDGFDLAAGASETLTVVMSVGPAAPNGSTISNTATLVGTTGGETIINTGDDSATESTSVLGEQDYGDAPDPSYPTLLASDGARHVTGGNTLFLGAMRDPELDGQPSALADGDGADEDGVVFTSGLILGDTATLDVTASEAGGLLSAWIDFDQNGSWLDAGEQIFADEPLAAGVNSLAIAVPATATEGDTYVRFRLDSGGGLLPTGLTIDGEVEDYLVTLAAEADLEVLKTGLLEPVTAGSTQVYPLAVTNLGPSTATDVELIDVIPAESTFVLAEPTADCAEVGGVVTCDLGDLAAGESSVVFVRVRVDPDAPDPIENVATVSSNETDPDTDNNDVMVLTEVNPLYGFAMLADFNGNGFPEVAVAQPGSIQLLVKDVETGQMFQDEQVLPTGFTLVAMEKTPDLNGNGTEDLAILARNQATGDAVLRVRDGRFGNAIANPTLPPDHDPLAMTVVADDGFGNTVLAVGARRLSNGQTFIFKRDATTGADMGKLPNATVLSLIDLTTVPSFTADTGVELATLWVNSSNGGRRIVVKELSTGAFLRIHNLPSMTTPVGIETIPNCCGLAAAEVATLSWEQRLDQVRVRTIDADSGGLVLERVFAVGAEPADLAVVPQVADSTADELAATYRFTGTRTAIRIRDAQTGAQIMALGVGTDSSPLGLAVSPDAYDSVADEVAVLWLNNMTGAVMLTLRDAGTAMLVVNQVIP